jgi:hypothetical protein
MLIRLWRMSRDWNSSSFSRGLHPRRIPSFVAVLGHHSKSIQHSSESIYGRDERSNLANHNNHLLRSLKTLRNHISTENTLQSICSQRKVQKRQKWRLSEGLCTLMVGAIAWLRCEVSHSGSHQTSYSNVILSKHQWSEHQLRRTNFNEGMYI